MANTIILSKVSLVSDILRSGCFTVPWHQRHYDWKAEQVSELLEDLHDAVVGKKPCYFIGSIMIVKSERVDSFILNDGQQRLITLSLVIASLCRRFSQMIPPDSARESRGLQALFDEPSSQILTLSDASRYKPRIVPPRLNKLNYQQLIRGLDIGTNGVLKAAWDIIDGFVGTMNKGAAGNFSDFLMQHVEVSVLQVPENLDVNAVFESLNARGKTLEDIDLIRNRIYSFFPDKVDANRRIIVHDKLESIGILLSPKGVQEYFRCYFQCQFGYLRKTRFYREVRRKIDKVNRQDCLSDFVFGLVEGLCMQQSIELFRTFTSSRPDEELNKFIPKVSGYRDCTVLLGELKEYKVTQPLIFALLHRFLLENDNTKKRKTGRLVFRSLKNLTSFVMRTTFISSKFEPSIFEAVFSNLARTVFWGTDLESLDIYNQLLECDEYKVIDNSRFIRRMKDIEFRSRAKALRFLFGVNSKQQIGSNILRRDHCAVEHVLPRSEKYWTGWNEFSRESAKDCLFRTGNMVILTQRENRSSEDFNRNFSTKRKYYQESTLQMPRDLATNSTIWTPEIVDTRSKALAREAAKVWQFSPPKDKIFANVKA